MKDETKRNIKETFDDLLLVAVCIGIAMSMKTGCSRMSENFPFVKSESVQNAKDSVANCIKMNHRQKVK